MSRATPDDQLKFLLNCVKHSNNGKIDFIEVAKECGIVSKGAAAKRYERLMKANGIHPNGGPSTQPTTPPATEMKRSKEAIAKSAAAKRRKIEGDDRSAAYDIQPKLSPKIEPKLEWQNARDIKAEPTTDPVPPANKFSMSSNLTAPPESQPAQFTFDDSSSLFEDFCTPELFAQHNFEETSTADQTQFMPPKPSPVERHTQVPREEPAANAGTGRTESIVIVD